MKGCGLMIDKNLTERQVDKNLQNVETSLALDGIDLTREEKHILKERGLGRMTEQTFDRYVRDIIQSTGGD